MKISLLLLFKDAQVSDIISKKEDEHISEEEKFEREFIMSRTERLAELFSKTIASALEEKINKAETKEDAERIWNHFESLDIQELFNNTMKAAAKDTFSFMKSTMFEEVMGFRADEQEFIAHQEQKWYRAFVASEAMYIMTLEAAVSYSEYVESLPTDEIQSKHWTYIVMQHIHGRALQEFLEIITLMKNGFADGAYARWRSMYELSIIASFIVQHGENVAKKFYEASETDDRYEWARESNIFSAKKKHITFNDIQKACDINSDVWKRQYDLANKTVHASPQGTFGRLYNMGTHPVIPVGRSDYGITTPGEHSAISLAQISAMFFTLFPESDTIIQMHNINHWIDVIREAYFKTHDEVFPEDQPLWDESLLQVDMDNED